MQPKGSADVVTPDSRAALVYGQPYETADGATIVTAAKVFSRKRRNGQGVPGEPIFVARPLGIFVIRDGKVTWEPAVDATRIALLGELIGLVAATVATLAILRRPPWPDLRAHWTSDRRG